MTILTDRRTTTSLRDIIRAELDAAPTPLDYSDVASNVLTQVDDPLAALRSVLHLVIGDVVRSQRGPLPPVTDLHPDPTPAPAGKTDAAAPKYDRRAAIRDAIEADLRQMYHTADGQKRLAELTVDDLNYVIAALREQANANLAKADQLAQYRDAMHARGVTRVEDLLT